MAAVSMTLLLYLLVSLAVAIEAGASDIGSVSLLLSVSQQTQFGALNHSCISFCLLSGADQKNFEVVSESSGRIVPIEESHPVY